MLDYLSVTELLGILIGLYFVAASLGTLIDPKSMQRLLPGLTENPMLAFLTGFVVFVIGGTIVAIHNVWNDLLSGFVSLVGWIALAEGLLFLTFRDKLARWFSALRFSVAFIVLFAAGTACIGIILLFLSFVGA